MDEYNFFRVWFPIGELREIVTVSKLLRKPALNYYRNMERVHESLLCAPCFTGVASRMAWAEAMADNDVERKYRENLESSSDAHVDAFWDLRWQRHLIRQIQIDEGSKEGSTGRFYGQAMQFMLKAMKRYPSFPLKTGLDAILSSAIVHASSAMETCLKQICEVACAQQVIKNMPVKSGKQARIDQSRIFYLAQDNRGVPRLLPESVRPSYTALGGFRMKYSGVFIKDSSVIDDAMASYDLDPVALVRNVLLHNNGMPDKMFRTQAKGIPILAPSLTLSDHSQIPLEGVFVSAILTSSLHAVKRVVNSVDQWLQRNS